MTNKYQIKCEYKNELVFWKSESLRSIIMGFPIPKSDYLVFKLINKSGYNNYFIANYSKLRDLFDNDFEFDNAYISDKLLIQYRTGSGFSQKFFNLTQKIPEIKKVRELAGKDSDGNSLIGLAEAKRLIEKAMDAGIYIELTENPTTVIPDIPYDPNEKLNIKLIESTMNDLDRVVNNG